MAAYFAGGGAGTDVQAGTDGLQTLYLMNPNFVGYTDATATPGGGGGGVASMMLLNSAVSTLTPASFVHQPAPPAAQHFVGIPLQAPAPYSGYSLWGPDAAGDDASPRHGQQVGPVLSLSSREAPPVTVAAVVSGGYEEKHAVAPPPEEEEQEQAVMRSRYLKAAQELLDEAVSVSRGVEDAKSAAAVKKKEDSEDGRGGEEDGGGSKSGGGGGAGEMSTAERQELQMKKSKLLSMLDEVEQRYRQYHRQMQAVAAAFEAAAGPRSARTYTALALRTISRQFRCLRDAIAAQLRSASRGLGEDCGDDAADGGAGGRTVGSRLRFIDHKLRQQRAMQQLGMVHFGGGGGWRPQRGLPERAVSVLRAWLFEHFLHPYPKDSDKVMLAKQTGLTRSQVSNWFINARVRLWKPMVEEMYAEETKAKEGPVAGDGGGGGSNNTGDSVVEAAKPDSCVGIGMSSSAMVAAGTTTSGDGVHTGGQGAPASFHGGDASFQHKLKRARPGGKHVPDVAVSHRELLMKFMEAGGEGASGHHPDIGDVAGTGGYTLFAPPPYGQFGSDHFAAFAGHGGVSLTLGLPHGAEQTPVSFHGGGAAVAAAGYDMNMQSTKSLATQLMRNFVA
ncbi:BEL1-like homeodomain protein 1 [Oryza brachyantha]|uniref:BEL1-like homeodomain protein 1 n=1 Tax=Oryza brachyantha TaxID=4533 RepID=UPI001ADC2998|nr:BEL1-like homeodomain protein 1 [Oryza brachyantha]XP_040385567.1 BEL1-like homeodomain protein 1 [Oryza brachyantha]